MNAEEAYNEIRKMAIEEGMNEDAAPESVVHFVADEINKKYNFKSLFQDKKARF